MDECCGGVLNKAILSRWSSERIYALITFGANLEFAHPRWKCTPLLTSLELNLPSIYNRFVLKGVKLPTLIIAPSNWVRACLLPLCSFLKYGTCLILSSGENDQCILSKKLNDVVIFSLIRHDMYSDWYETREQRLNSDREKICSTYTTYTLRRGEERVAFFEDFFDTLVYSRRVFLYDGCKHAHTRSEIENTLYGTCFAGNGIKFGHQNNPASLLSLTRDVITKNTLHEFPASLLNYEIPSTLQRYLIHLYI